MAPGKKYQRWMSERISADTKVIRFPTNICGPSLEGRWPIGYPKRSDSGQQVYPVRAPATYHVPQGTLLSKIDNDSHVTQSILLCRSRFSNQSFEQVCLDSIC